MIIYHIGREIQRTVFRNNNIHQFQVKNFELEQQAAAQLEPLHIPTEAETLEYGPAIFTLHNEIAASKERIAQTVDRFEKKREVRGV